MSCETTSNGDTAKRGGIPDFSRRADLTELMDGPCSYEDLRRCYEDLAQVNRVTLAYGPTLRWLEQFAVSADREHPLHIVDVGCGGGDMLRRIEDWAARRRVPVRLTGIDLNPKAVDIARELTPASGRIEWVSGDAHSFDAGSAPIDLVISSLFTHHLPEEEIVCFLKWMEQVVRRGWFISDLYRSRTSYLGFAALATTARWHRFIRHDGPVSIRRAFLPEEWKEYVEASGLSQHLVRFDRRWPGRLCVARVKGQ